MAKKLVAKSRKYKFQYAIKFICTSHIPGTSQLSDAVVPGFYQTAVNIHNPGEKRVKFRMKVASPIEISPFISSELKGDGVQRVTCADLPKFEIHNVHGFEGFLVIESRQSLDVVAVYTAAPNGGQVSSLDVEYVAGRKL